MKVYINILLTIFTITMALTLFLTTHEPAPQPPKPVFLDKRPVPVSRVSRFLQQRERNPRAADHCRRDNEICNYILEGRNTTCCNNKCVDLGYDDNNCGACKHECAFTETCCRGQCVNLAYDKRHCGSCNRKCMEGGFCIYGICDYA